MTDGAPFGPAFWDERYRAEPDLYGAAPNAFLEEMRPRLPATGNALVPGDGQGRNGLWLAREGFSVVSIDQSAEATATARLAAEAEGLPLEARTGDLLDVAMEAGAYDVVALVYVHMVPEVRAAVHARCAAALRPGGHLVYEAFAPAQIDYRERYGSGGPGRADVLPGFEILAADFAALEPLLMEEREVVLAEGRGHAGPAMVMRGLFAAPFSEPARAR